MTGNSWNQAFYILGATKHYRNLLVFVSQLFAFVVGVFGKSLNLVKLSSNMYFKTALESGHFGAVHTKKYINVSSFYVMVWLKMLNRKCSRLVFLVQYFYVVVNQIMKPFRPSFKNLFNACSIYLRLFKKAVLWPALYRFLEGLLENPTKQGLFKEKKYNIAFLLKNVIFKESFKALF